MVRESSLRHPDGETCAHCGAERSPRWRTDVNGNVFCSDDCQCYYQQGKSAHPDLYQ